MRKVHKVYVEAEMLYYAFRYALGRRSYASAWVVDNILANIKEIPTEMHEQIIREIDEGQYSSDDHIGRDWTFLRYRLVKEIEQR